MREVKLRDAKASLSALVAAAEGGEWTTITRHGKPVAVLIPVADAKRPRKKTFAEHLLAFPGGVDLERDQTPLRDIEW